MGRVPPMRSSIGAIILQLLGGIIPFAIFYWGFGIAIWLAIVLGLLGLLALAAAGVLVLILITRKRSSGQGS